MTVRRGATVLAAGCLATVTSVVACSGVDGAVEAEVGEVTSSGVVVDVSVSESPRSTLAFVLELEAAEDVTVQVTAAGEDGHAVTMPLTDQPATEHTYPIVGLRAEQRYELTVQALDPDASVVGAAAVDVTTGSLPDSLPELDVDVADSERMAAGLTLFDVGLWGVDGSGRSNGVLLALDDTGEVVWYVESLFTVGDSRLTDDGRLLVNYPDFLAQEMDILGEPVVSWAVDGPGDGGEELVLGPEPGTYTGVHHEVNRLDNGNTLALVRLGTDLTPEERERYCPGDPMSFRLREDRVVEYEPDGSIAREWSLRDVIDPAETPGSDLCTSERLRDWTHANAAVLDEVRNAVIVTARHIDTVFAFRYDADDEGPSGELLWSLGPGGTMELREGELTYHPHATEVLPDGDLIVYDNGNGRPGTAPDDPDRPTYSRAVRFEIDDSAEDAGDWTARQVWEHRVDDRDGSPLFAEFLGDADVLDNGNVLVDHGGIGQFVPPSRGRIVEVVPDGPAGGDIVFDLWLEDGWVSYRAERIPSLYAGPDWTPPTRSG